MHPLLQIHLHVSIMNAKKILSLLGLFCVLSLPGVAQAQESMVAQQVTATITSISVSEGLEGGVHRFVFEAQAESGETFTVDTADSYVAGVGYQLKAGDKMLLRLIEQNGVRNIYIEDVHRESGLWLITLLFVLVTLAVGLVRGFLSLIGLGVTMVVLVVGLLPAILHGADPVTATVLASIVILGVNMHLSHGFKRQTFLAFLSTVAGLSLVIVFTNIFISLARLSGLASEEGALLFSELNHLHLPAGILAAGIILGAAGVLDDIAITQTEVVEELYETHPELNRKQLFAKAMRVGRHHIASTVNTLILVYAGAALPAFLLYMNQFSGYQAFFNNEQIAEELVRTLAGTCALVLTVPISTWFATIPRFSIDKKTKKS